MWKCTNFIFSLFTKIQHKETFRLETLHLSRYSGGDVLVERKKTEDMQ